MPTRGTPSVPWAWLYVKAMRLPSGLKSGSLWPSSSSLGAATRLIRPLRLLMVCSSTGPLPSGPSLTTATVVPPAPTSG